MTNALIKDGVLMNDLKLSFGTNTNDIDANTLMNSVLHFSALVHEVNREMKTNRKIDVKVRAFEPGSFVVNIVIESGLIEMVESFFTGENVAYAAGLVGVIDGVYRATKFFKGEKPATIEENNQGIKVENVTGDVTIIDKRVYNIYQSPVVQNILAKEFETLDNDSEVQGFDIITGISDRETIRFNREEFSDIANIDFAVPENSRTVQKLVTLSIITLSFDPKKKWEFMYDGHKIHAKINDDLFHQHIDGGEAFAKGDILKGTMEITQKFNDLAGAYGNHSYKVIAISDHIRLPRQNPMF